MESLKPVIDKLEKLFSKFNDRFYGGELQNPVITVSPDSTKGAYGWCTSWKAWKEAGNEDKDAGYYEINICAEHLTRTFEELCGTLLHLLSRPRSRLQQTLRVAYMIRCRFIFSTLKSRKHKKG